MKYFLRILLVLVIAAGVVFGVYYYTTGKNITSDNNSVSLTTVTKAPATEKNSNRVLIASLEEENYYLYKSGSTVILQHNDNEFEFNNWSDMIDKETPSMYYANFDSDNDKELVIRAVSSQDESTNEYIYNIYVLNEKRDDNGKESYDVTLASRSTWSSILDQYIIEELSQLKTCKKIVQFAMNGIGNPVKYDKTTGIVKNCYAGYARAIQDSKGNYLTVDKWSKGNGIYTISDDNKISVDIAINISYKNSSIVQNAGNLHFELSLDKANNFYPTKQSVMFIASDEYRVANPRTTAEESWSYIENNSDNSVYSSNKTISWIKYTTKYDPTISTQTVRYTSEGTDIADISKIVITDSYIELTAKSGCSFDDEASQNGEFSVIINAETNEEYDIAYTAEISKSGENEVLKISFDKSYPQNEIETLDINYGLK